MEVSGQLHATAVLTPGKERHVSIFEILSNKVNACATGSTLQDEVLQAPHASYHKVMQKESRLREFCSNSLISWYRMPKDLFLYVRIATIHKPFNQVSLTDPYQVLLYKWNTTMATCFGYVKTSKTDTTCYERTYFERYHFNKDADYLK